MFEASPSTQQRDASRHPSILIVDDDDSMRDLLTSILRNGYRIAGANGGRKALQLLEKRHIDIVLLDIRMPDMNGLDVLKEIKERWPKVVVIMITVIKEIKSAVRAMQLGAFDYINKDFDYDEMRALIEKAVTQMRADRELHFLRDEVVRHTHRDLIIGETGEMQAVKELMQKAGAVPSTVLITGESGTGKEMVARQIHTWSDREKGPFVAVNLASIPSELIESTLFGHERGAFTGAIAQRYGKFELAHEGTLFLDEISELRIDLQAKLLRAIQEGEVERVGAAHPIPVDVRLIAATNTDLQKEVREGRFREDLYYRLHVLPIDLPPLRRRMEDIPQLLHLFIKRYSDRFHRRIEGIDDEALAILKAYHWPGNIRELENLVERMVALADSPTLTEFNIPVEYRVHPLQASKQQMRMSDALKLAVEGFERAFILQTLAEENWHQGKTAERLGIHRKTLEYKIKKLNIKRNEKS